MARYWTCYWQNAGWTDGGAPQYQEVTCSGSNVFTSRGVSPGDFAYIVSVIDGHLMLGGRMVVGDIVPRVEAMLRLRTRDLWDASEWLLAREGTGTVLDFRRRLSPELTRRLRFVTKSTSPQALRFVSPGRLDTQTIRSIRELSEESARLLDRIIDTTDGREMANPSVTLTVEERDLEKATGGIELPSETGDASGAGDKGTAQVEADGPPDVEAHGESDPERDRFARLPEEVDERIEYWEGSVRRVTVNRYERDYKARDKCIRKKGAVCSICGFDAAIVYGPDFEGMIHVHHVRPLSEVGEEYHVDPEEDLEVVCPNCHAAIHFRGQNRRMEEVRRLVHERFRRSELDEVST